MNEYIGTIGEKIAVKVTLTKEYSFMDYRHSYYGTEKYIYTFTDESGNTLVWKTTSILQIPNPDSECGCDFIHKGDIITLTGKVKAHDEYKGINQTVLERCKVTEIVERALTKEEQEEIRRQEQLDSLTEDDFIWNMPYRQYKEHYSDCETVAGSYNDGCDSHGYRVREATIAVIIRNGRLKTSGVRGQHFSGYKMTNQNGKHIVYRAVSEKNAMKRVQKDFPDDTWECTAIF